MDFNATPFNVSTALLIAFACCVIYLRLKGNFETNIPLFYYGIMVYYVVAYEALPPVVVYIALILGLLLRFEFMNTKVAKALMVLECCALGTIIYFNLATIMSWA
jgi:hypothetical protein